ncbi:hypothetical protein CPAST_c05550 [Clostridium pasteurianum DSM 525 = ATCC 6013]|uniref:DUF5107 domain-containing protein n=2 Tax=Clostridium pasteurianum TaxID=1501 RepID=A0A0H3J6R2_CLOPA|nr:DUF5107 domain-containing protein [Clostridium pasteurianum]AJA46655.1 hypothetical protein CPAST_c05550 [Clostridium pasteurianum DSM 525 = ATCC 6013]AJA50643.1 hypothetical protein CLPA_c05550 [Clostridium pasteurianum DSM 525 = ATCC 6013]AOZ74065.1 hypothetical protein AQ983_02660 [Clostridium pasteurianum DSM 525 = ATCC 6013]AOZ77862.1 hypothetical protein AQ984_02660 [Clostridium pasteurianum]ELP61220.1 hypothetical protein F502_02155 [Clostridium pasteurianum DSM 525 = ATCC 6013]
MIYKSNFKNMNSITLENDLLKVIIIPDLGGKLVSIYNKSSNFELLFQNKEDSYKKPELNSDFGSFDASGFDDAFPTIDISKINYQGQEILYPDHGEIWSSPFDYRFIDDYLELTFSSRILPYNYKKVIHLEEDTVKIKYTIANKGTSPFPCIWAMHCLVNCSEDMEIYFPKDTTEIINVHDSTVLGKKNSIHSYPVTKDINGKDYNLNRVGSKDLNKTEKYYINGIVNEGECSIYYPENSSLFMINFDKNKLPYVGFWVTEGGFRGDYNCALEPTNSFYDDIDTAFNNNKLYYLTPKEPLQFEISLALRKVEK